MNTRPAHQPKFDPMAKAPSKKNDTSANLGFEAKLWLTADKLRNNMDAAETAYLWAWSGVTSQSPR